MNPDGAYLISGGLGGLGLKIAQWLADQGARRLILLSRKELPPKSEWGRQPSDRETTAIIETLKAIEAKGVEVEPVSCDVGSRKDMKALFRRLKLDKVRPLKGIIHAAVAMSGASIEALNSDQLKQMFHAKVGGAMLLDELSQDQPLDFFVLFSSTTALWGVAGLGHYAAANQMLDMLAHLRRREGRPAVSVNWGTWESMRIASRSDRKAFREAGLIPLPARKALNLMGRLLETDLAQICAASVDWERLRDLYEVRRSRPIFRRIGKSKPVQRTKRKSSAGGMVDRLKELSDDRRRIKLVEHLQTRVREVLRLDARDTVDSEKGFFDMGMDSLMAVELRSLLEKDLSLSLPSTLTFNYPTIDELAGFIIEHLSLEEGSMESDQHASTVSDALPEEIPSHDTLTEEELSALLLQKLKDIE